MNFLLTGASGFLGQVLSQELKSNNQDYKSLGLSIENDLKQDLRYEFLVDTFFETVIHSAGKAHINPRTESEKMDFYQINYIGTLNLLNGLKIKPKNFVFISSCAVYGDIYDEIVDENFELKGNTPYAESKIFAERAVIEWCSKFDINYLILRLPLIVGDNPKGNLEAMINALKDGWYVKISNNKARKSIVVADDLAKFIVNRTIDKSGIYNLTDGVNPFFSEIEDALEFVLERKALLKLPKLFLSTSAKFGDIVNNIGIKFPIDSDRVGKITKSLIFSDDKARKELGWKSTPAVQYIRDNF